jgi:hypothetical protein
MDVWMPVDAKNNYTELYGQYRLANLLNSKQLA